MTPLTHRTGNDNAPPHTAKHDVSAFSTLPQVPLLFSVCSADVLLRLLRACAADVSKQSLHVDAPAFAVVPSGHAIQSLTLLCAVAAVYLPAAHSTQPVARLLAWYWPAGHRMQLGCPCNGWYWPAGHEVQLACPRAD